jgi:magnesium transporter
VRRILWHNREASMIRIYRWDTTANAGEWLPAETLTNDGKCLQDDSCVVWIDLENPTPEEETLVLEEFFHVHALSFEDIQHVKNHPDRPPHFPKVEEFPDYLFVVVNPLSEKLLNNMALVGKEADDVLFENGSPVTQLSAVLTKQLIITHHYEALRGVRELRGYLDKHRACAGRGPDFLFHLVLDEMVDEYAPVLDHFGDVLEDYELRMFRKPSQRMLTRMIRCKRAIIILRKTLIYEREVLARLSRGEFDMIDERESVYYRNVYDHLIRFTELIESSREMVSDLLQMHLAASSNRLNEVMKVLTMISTTVLPMTLIAGIYGMNFERLVPDTKAEHGFEFSLALMLLAGLGSLLFFRWKKWF